MSHKTDKPSASTLRWRRYYNRQKAGRGERFISVVIDHELIELLLESGKIDDSVSEDPKTLAEVVRRCCVELCTSALDTGRIQSKRAQDRGQMQ